MAVNCKPITISDCPPVNTCDACKEIVKASCIDWDGNEPSCPQACVKLHRVEEPIAGTNRVELSYAFFSCSPTLSSGCTKSYKIFDQLGYEVYSGTLSGATTYAVGTIAQNGNQIGSLTQEASYKIVEYITCEGCSTESLDLCFKTKRKSVAVSQGQDIQTRIRTYIVPSCNCCVVDLTGYDITLEQMNCGDSVNIDFGALFDGVLPAEVVVVSSTGGTVTMIDTLNGVFTAEAGYEGEGSIVFRFIDSEGNYMKPGIYSTNTITIPITCPDFPTEIT